MGLKCLCWLIFLLADELLISWHHVDLRISQASIPLVVTMGGGYAKVRNAHRVWC